MESDIFVTYSYESESYNELVYSFVNYLRELGFDATCDENRKQLTRTANFSTIMTEGLKSEVVIVILSNEYKRKAESGKGGVGAEYKFISNDLQNNCNKYIFVTFDEIDDETLEQIVPVLYKSYEVIDLTRDEINDYQKLLSKLKNMPYLEFSDVSNVLQKVATKEIRKFSLKKKFVKDLEKN